MHLDPIKARLSIARLPPMKVKLSVDNIFTVYRECTICLSEISHALKKYFILSIGDIG